MKRVIMTRLKAGLIAVAMLLAQIVLPVQPAFASNNGTLKVHEYSTRDGTESTSPHVCTFNFEGYQFDEGQTGSILVSPQGGDSDTTDSVSVPFGPADEDGFYKTAYVNDGGSLQLDNGHYKSTLYGKDVNGNYTIDLKAKSKNFKVECTGASVTIPTQSTIDPCNEAGVTNNLAWEMPLPSDTDQIDWAESDNGATRTATLKNVLDSWTDGSKLPWVFTLSQDQDSGVQCETEESLVVIPAAPLTIDECNPRDTINNVRWQSELPADTDEIDWTESADGTTRTATLKGDRLWSDETADPIVFVLPGDSGEACEEESIESYVVSLSCPISTYFFSVKNTGETDLEVAINEHTEILTPKDDPIELTFQVGDVLSVAINGTPVEIEGKVLDDFTLVTCQGMGGINPEKPVVPVVETIQGQGAAGQLPAELPMTGAGGTISTWFALLAAVLTYGAVLFLQPKKRLEE